MVLNNAILKKGNSLKVIEDFFDFHKENYSKAVQSLHILRKYLKCFHKLSHRMHVVWNDKLENIIFLERIRRSSAGRPASF